MLTPKTTRLFERELALLAKTQWKESPLTGPLSVNIWFNFERPKKPKSDYPKQKDLDNLAKAVLDSMNGVVWADDKQICILNLAKQFTARSQIIVEVHLLELSTQSQSDPRSPHPSLPHTKGIA
jgi:Holliday junction resolvase RusA-like endonuclease